MTENVLVNGDYIRFIKTSVVDDENDTVTITLKNVDSSKFSNSYSYKVSPDGKIIIQNGIDTDSDEDAEYSREKLVSLLKDIAFENIPEDLSDRELKKIYDYAVKNIDKKMGNGRIHPVGVDVTDLGKVKTIKIILIMYNGNKSELLITKLPLKLRDADGKTVFADLVDVNQVINPQKIGIFHLKFSNYDTLVKEMDLSSWSVTFEMK